MSVTVSVPPAPMEVCCVCQDDFPEKDLLPCCEEHTTYFTCHPCREDLTKYGYKCVMKPAAVQPADRDEEYVVPSKVKLSITFMNLCIIAFSLPKKHDTEFWVGFIGWFVWSCFLLYMTFISRNSSGEFWVCVIFVPLVFRGAIEILTTLGLIILEILLKIFLPLLKEFEQ